MTHFTTDTLKHRFKTAFKLSPLVLALQCAYAHAADEAEKDTASGDISAHYIPVSSLDESSRKAFLKKRPYCNGVWVQPNKKPLSSTANNTNNKNKRTDTASSSDNQPIIATADSVYLSPDNIGKLYGDVQITQGDKTVKANQIDIDLKTNIATATGNIALSDGDIYSTTKQLSYDLDKKDSSVTQSSFFSEKRQAHGTAGKIEQSEVGVINLEDVSYSTCPPEQVQDTNSQTNPAESTAAKVIEPNVTKAKSWEIQAERLKLDENTGRGYADNVRLNLLGIPTLYLPYINFPIDDRRMSGFLVPNMGFSNDGGLDLSLPYYFNLASNYDLTLTPRILFSRGGMLEGEFRYLSDGYGEAKIEGGFLPSDNDYGDKNREYVKATHQWDISRRFKSTAEYNYVSDKDFFNDLGTNPLVQDELNLPRNIVLDYTDDKRELEGQIRVETFQTVDKTLADSAKPYSRLPQLTANYTNGTPLGLMTDVAVDFGYFQKNIDDGSAVEDSGSRYYGKVGASYNIARPWGFVKPSVSVEQLITVFDETSVQQQNLVKGENDTESITLPSISLDGGLVFESNDVSLGGMFNKSATQGMTQTIEPRFFYSYAPFKDQSRLPNFDTTTASLSYDQLFTSQRFLGHDRLADTNALSLGINYKLFDDTGLERLSLGLGNKFNFNNQQVQIDGKQATVPDTSGPIARAQGYITPQLKLSTDLAYQDNGDPNFQVTQLSWQPKPKTLVNVGYFDRARNTTDNQKRLKQATASLVMPLTDRWQLMAHGQYDLRIDKARDFLVGANYESCCYRLAVYGRHYYNNLDDPRTTDANNRFMIELSLKGLAGFSDGLANLLKQKVLGYERFSESSLTDFTDVTDAPITPDDSQPVNYSNYNRLR